MMNLNMAVLEMVNGGAFDPSVMTKEQQDVYNQYPDDVKKLLDNLYDLTRAAKESLDKIGQDYNEWLKTKNS